MVNGREIDVFPALRISIQWILQRIWWVPSLIFEKTSFVGHTVWIQPHRQAFRNLPHLSRLIMCPGRFQRWSMPSVGRVESSPGKKTKSWRQIWPHDVVWERSLFMEDVGLAEGYLGSKWTHPFKKKT